MILLSINNLKRSEIETLISTANQFSEQNSPSLNKQNFVLGILFFEESSRTQIGFQSSVYKLGGNCFTLKETKYKDSMSTAESIEDTFRVLQAYADILCVRHPDSNIFDKLSSLIEKPLINCGNGSDEHPSQALLDLMTINNIYNRIDKLRIAMVGDLRFMRTSHSLLLALAKFNNIFTRCISPHELRIPDIYKSHYLESGNILEETDKMLLNDIDLVYMTGFAPKTPIGNFSEQIRKLYQINEDVINQLQSHTSILCPLPRIDEISSSVDKYPQAKYFLQNQFGQFMRMAILAKYLNIS